MRHVFFLASALAILALVGCGSFRAKAKNSAVTPPKVTKSDAELEALRKKTEEKKEAGDEGTATTVDTGTPKKSGLKAGFADDNKQFNYYLGFLNKYRSKVKVRSLNVSERIRLHLLDKNKRPIANAAVKIQAGGKTLSEGNTYPDGSFYFYPSMVPTHSDYSAEVTYRQKKRQLKFERTGKRKLELIWPTARTVEKQLAVDIVFIFDTTASMGEEIARLKNTIELISLNVSNISPKPLLRFGMVLYKDKNDEYNTKIVKLTANLKAFMQELHKVEAGGGGDIPENLEAALADATNKINWNQNAIKLGFVITDAPPHLDYGNKFTYISAAQKAKKEGIKLFSIGTGGLPLDGEYVLRQIAQYTQGKYIFLTYGEKGESSGGRTGSVSHHTGQQFVTDKLESIVIRFTKEEIRHQLDRPIDDSGEYFVASKMAGEKREKTLAKLFNRALRQLIDYSSIKISADTPTALAPLNSKKKYRADAEYFSEQVLLAARRNRLFKVVERKDLQKLLAELELQQSGVIKEDNVTKVGTYAGAKLMVIGHIYRRKNKYELFLKLVRVKTAEVVAVTKAEVDVRLGISI